MINSKNTVLLAATLFSLGLAGCSSTSPSEDFEARQAKAKQDRIEKEEVKFEAVPDWFLEPPENNDSGIYAVGTATSNNLQFTINNAKLNAEFSLAKNLNQEVSGRERAMMRAGTNGNVESDAESVITKFVDSADIVGVQTVKKEVVLLDGKYSAFVLLHLSYEQQAKILSRKNTGGMQATAKQAYEEVEAEVRRRAAERNKLEVDKAAAEAEAKAKVKAEYEAKQKLEEKANLAANPPANDDKSSAGGIVQLIEKNI